MKCQTPPKRDKQQRWSREVESYTWNPNGVNQDHSPRRSTRYDQNEVVLWYGPTRCWRFYSRSSLNIQKMWSHRNIQYDLIRSGQHGAHFWLMRCDSILDSILAVTWASGQYVFVFSLNLWFFFFFASQYDANHIVDGWARLASFLPVCEYSQSYYTPTE